MGPLVKIAILDDDIATLSKVSSLLEDASYACACFELVADLLKALAHESFDLFVLDWNLPDGSGLSVVERIRNQIGGGVPILLLTSRSLEQDIVTGLNAGADDFVTKPFQPGILLARVNALSRRQSGFGAAPAQSQLGDLRFNLKERTVSRNNEEIALTAKEFQLALLLRQNLDRALSRKHILETIWGMRADIPTRTIDSHIAKLRTKLDLRPEKGFRLTSVYGYGYRLEVISGNP